MSVVGERTAEESRPPGVVDEPVTLLVWGCCTLCKGHFWGHLLKLGTLLGAFGGLSMLLRLKKVRQLVGK